MQFLTKPAKYAELTADRHGPGPGQRAGTRWPGSGATASPPTAKSFWPTTDWSIKRSRSACWKLRGHRVEVVNTGREALAALERRSFDVVLMDLEMPDMDGLEATAAIRERERLQGGHIPIVAMTAHAIKGFREQCLAAGMDDYITKPIEPRELFRAVESFPPQTVSDANENAAARPGTPLRVAAEQGIGH